jgi:hypothetical protein
LVEVTGVGSTLIGGDSTGFFTSGTGAIGGNTLGVLFAGGGGIVS